MKLSLDQKGEIEATVWLPMITMLAANIAAIQLLANSWSSKNILQFLLIFAHKGAGINYGRGGLPKRAKWPNSLFTFLTPETAPFFLYNIVKLWLQHIL